MNIYTSNQIKELENRAVIDQGITWPNLMEKAAEAFISQLHLRFLESFDQCCIFCGAGNNGGDGIVIGKILSGFVKYPVYLYLIDAFKTKADLRKDYSKQIIHNKNINIYSIDDQYIIPNIGENTLVIDALFGIGLNRLIEGDLTKVISAINNSSSTVVSVDIPSGMYSNKPNHINDTVVRSDLTITFQFPKISFFFEESLPYLQKCKVADIGLQEYPEKIRSKWHITEKEGLLCKIKTRVASDHKGKYGKTLVIGGSHGMYGAPVLAALGAMNSGSGYISVLVPKGGADTARSIPDIIVQTADNEDLIDHISFTDKDTIAIGPGFGQSAQSRKVLSDFIKSYTKPMVIDADAINIISIDNLLEFIPENSILTPHQGEFERLAGSSSDSLERLQLQRELSEEYKCIIVLKGPGTSVSAPDGNIYFNITGNPALATGGTGDVLTGVIAALLAQGYESLTAARLGVFIHGLAADIYVRDHNESSLTASLLSSYIVRAWDELYESSEQSEL